MCRAGRWFLLGVALVAVALALPVSSVASDSPLYRTYLTCDEIGPFSLRDPPEPSHVCTREDAWGGVFISKDKGVVHYRICARRPDRSHVCYRRETFQHWETDGLWGTTGFQQRGRYMFTWRVGGRVVDRDPFWLRP
jgi:hypothetical protein